MSSTTATGRSLAYLALVGGILCIAWSAIFVRWTDIPGPASAFYRLLIPALVLAPTWLFDRKTPRVDARTLAIICVGGVFFALDLAFYNTSILKTSAANATLLGNNTPIFVGLITWLVFRRRPDGAFWLGLALAAAGSLVIVWGDLAQRAHLGWGDAMALAASACFAVYLLATEEVRGHTGTLVFLRLAIVSSAAFLLALNLAMRVPLGSPFGTIVWGVAGAWTGFAAWRVFLSDLCDGAFAGDGDVGFAAVARAIDGVAGGLSVA